MAQETRETVEPVNIGSSTAFLEGLIAEAEDAERKLAEYPALVRQRDERLLLLQTIYLEIQGTDDLHPGTFARLRSAVEGE